MAPTEMLYHHAICGIAVIPRNYQCKCKKQNGFGQKGRVFAGRNVRWEVYFTHTMRLNLTC
ncbi:hypothetical protein DBR40_23585 [Pedobacter sp. KBW01]|nr:hypothetical protein DBR40_23585 [Pedobacter sp. KBW01]